MVMTTESTTEREEITPMVATFTPAPATEFEFNNDHRPDPIFEHVPPGLLKIDDRYQRPLQESRIRAWQKRGINEIAMQPLTVSMRPSGARYVIDGQHRLALALKSNLVTVPCWTHQGLTLEDEALGFDEANKTQKNASPLHRFKALLIYGDPMAHGIQKALQSAGYFIGSNDQPGSIRAIGALETMYRFDGPEGIMNTLHFIDLMWGKLDKNTTKSYLLLASFYFLRLYRSKNGSIGDLTKRMNGIDTTEIFRRSRTLERSESTSSHADAIYRVLIDISNRNRQAANRIAYVPLMAGAHNPKSTMTESTAIAIINRYNRGETIDQIAHDTDLPYGTVWGVATRRTWSYLGRDDESEAR